MNPQLVSKIAKATGPLFNPLVLLYLLIDEFTSWRLFPAWFESFRRHYSLLQAAMPWLPFKATHWLRSYLRRDMKVFEYGSGGSTIFLAQHAGKVFTVEHDKNWYTRVSLALRERGLANCFYELREPRSPGGTFSGGGRRIRLSRRNVRRKRMGISWNEFRRVRENDRRPSGRNL